MHFIATTFVQGYLQMVDLLATLQTLTHNS